MALIPDGPSKNLEIINESKNGRIISEESPLPNVPKLQQFTFGITPDGDDRGAVFEQENFPML